MYKIRVNIDPKRRFVFDLSFCVFCMDRKLYIKIFGMQIVTFYATLQRLSYP